MSSSIVPLVVAVGASGSMMVGKNKEMPKWGMGIAEEFVALGESYLPVQAARRLPRRWTPNRHEHE